MIINEWQIKQNKIVQIFQRKEKRHPVSKNPLKDHALSKTRWIVQALVERNEKNNE